MYYFFTYFTKFIKIYIKIKFLINLKMFPIWTPILFTYNNQVIINTET